MKDLQNDQKLLDIVGEKKIIDLKTIKQILSIINTKSELLYSDINLIQYLKSQKSWDDDAVDYYNETLQKWFHG